MNTRLTVADARAVLASYATPAGFLPCLNEVCERYINSGLWEGTRAKVQFPTSSGFVTLPPQYLSILEATIANYPVQTFGPFHEFSITGPGIIDPNNGPLNYLMDYGDGFPTAVDIVTPGTLKVRPTGGAESGKNIRIFGEDADGVQISETLSLNATYTVSTNTFAKVITVEKDATAAEVELYVVNTTDVLLSTYLPGETKPAYHRYKTGVQTQPIDAIVRIRHVPLVTDHDWVRPSNIGALKAGFRALNFEDAGDFDRSAASWKQGTDILNLELRSARGGALTPAPFRPSGVRRGRIRALL